MILFLNILYLKTILKYLFLLFKLYIFFFLQNFGTIDLPKNIKISTDCRLPTPGLKYPKFEKYTRYVHYDTSTKIFNYSRQQ